MHQLQCLLWMNVEPKSKWQHSVLLVYEKWCALYLTLDRIVWAYLPVWKRQRDLPQGNLTNDNYFSGQYCDSVALQSQNICPRVCILLALQYQDTAVEKKVAVEIAHWKVLSFWIGGFVLWCLGGGGVIRLQDTPVVHRELMGIHSLIHFLWFVNESILENRLCLVNRSGTGTPVVRL